jgi:hypothetical protein
MSKFLTPLDLRKLKGRNWRLLDDLIFVSDKYGPLVAPKGAETNLASIPRATWIIFPPVGNYDEAAAIHDCACRHTLVTLTGQRIHCVKFVADNLFKEALDICDINKVTKNILYNMVKAFNPYHLPDWLKEHDNSNASTISSSTDNYNS